MRVVVTIITALLSAAFAAASETLIDSNFLETAAQCVDSPADWVDSNNLGCSDYDKRPKWCKLNPENYANDGVSALDACCICGGGDSSTPSPTNTPTVAPSDEPSVFNDEKCTDFPDFKDRSNYGCYTYDERPFWCTVAKNFMNREGVSASDACCVCGGGNTPTLSPTQSPEPKSNDGECMDYPDFEDASKLGCESYTKYPSWCSVAKDYANSDGVSAEDACCVCGGGKTSDSYDGKVYFIKSYKYGTNLRFWEDKVDMTINRDLWEMIELIQVKGGKYLIKSDHFNNTYLSTNPKSMKGPVMVSNIVTANEEFEIMKYRDEMVTIKHVNTGLYLKAGGAGDFAAVELSETVIGGTIFELEEIEDVKGVPVTMIE